MTVSRTRAWQLQDAKNRFSEVVEEALNHGPQVITRRGQETAVLLSFDDYTRLARQRRPLVDVLRSAPKSRAGLDVARSRDVGRDVDL